MTEIHASEQATRVIAVPDPPDHPSTVAVAIQPRPSGRKSSPLTITVASRAGEPIVPGYRIIGRLGRGGMGVVYKAIHLALNRTVALKMLGGSSFEVDADTRVRFRKEAEALASLRHLNIVPVFEVGESEGLPFFTMEFVEGGDLATYLLAYPPTPTTAAQIAVQLARAVQAAHEAGILHRDLKPSNVLLGRVSDSGELVQEELKTSNGRPTVIPKIADFGLAKRFGVGHSDRTVTQAGDILGTPSYMAPEQAEGHGSGRIGPSADIYSLGAILYEMLARRPPFDAEDAVRTVLKVLNDEPTPPAKIATGIPRDLEIICLKCLQKEPGKRYSSAGAMADDLERFLAGRPIVARPISTPERVWKWARRHPAVAGLLATTVVALLVGFIGVTAMWMRANDRALRELQARELADERGRLLEAKALEIEARLAASYLEQGLAACKEGDIGRGIVLMVETLHRNNLLRQRAGPGLDLDRLDHIDNVARTNIARWATRMPLQRRANFFSPRSDRNSWVLDVDLSPDGTRAVNGTADGVLRMFDAETTVPIGEPIHPGAGVAQVTFASDGKHFLTLLSSDKRGEVPYRIQLWDSITLQRVGPALPVSGFEAMLPIFPTPSALFFAGFISADRIGVQEDETTIRFYQIGAKEPSGRAIHSEMPILQAIPVDEGRILITGHADGSVRRWNIETGAELARTRAAPHYLSALSIDRSGKRLLAGTWAGLIRQFDAQSLEPVGPEILAGGGTDKEAGRLVILFGADYSPNGREIAVGGGKWRLNADEKRLGLLQVFKAESGNLQIDFPSPDPVWSFSYGANGAVIVAAEEACKIRVHSAHDGSLLYTYNQAGNPAKVVIGRDEKTVFAADRGFDPSPLLAELGTMPLQGPMARLGAECGGMAFTPDGRGLRALSRDGKLHHIDVKNGRAVSEPIAMTKGAYYLLGSADGRYAAIATDENRSPEGIVIELWNLEKNVRLSTIRLDAFHRFEFRADEEGIIASSIRDTTVRAFGLDGKEKWHRTVGIPKLDNDFYLTAYSIPDRTVLAGARYGRKIGFLNGDTGVPTGEVLEVPAAIENFVMHPNGRSVIVVFADGYVRSYDRQKGQPNGAAIPWKGRHIHVRLSPDGSTLMVRTEELESATLSQYDPITGLTIGPSIPVHRVGMPLVFSSSSRALAIADWENIRCWDMPGPMAGPVEHIRLWSEIMSRRAFVAEPVETQTLLDDRAVGLKKKQLREQWGGAPIPAQK